MLCGGQEADAGISHVWDQLKMVILSETFAFKYFFGTLGQTEASDGPPTVTGTIERGQGCSDQL